MDGRAGLNLCPVQRTFLLGGKWEMESGIKLFVFTFDDEEEKETADLFF